MIHQLQSTGGSINKINLHNVSGHIQTVPGGIEIDGEFIPYDKKIPVNDR